MPGNKYVSLSAGELAEVAGAQASAGVGDANKIVALDATGKLDITLMPTGVGADSRVITTSEALAAGDVCNVHDVAGASRVRKADATTDGKEAMCFVNAAFGSGAAATVYFEGTITGLSGMVAGQSRYLHTTAGLTTSAPPSAAGNISQRVGMALSATELSFEPQRKILVA